MRAQYIMAYRVFQYGATNKTRMEVIGKNSSLFKKVFKCKYFSGISFFKAALDRNPSYGDGIAFWQGEKFFIKGLR